MLAPKPYNPPAAETLKTLYSDAFIVVCDKPSGLLSVPGRGPEKAICASSIAEDRHGPILIIHRLDMDTSGVIIFARTLDGQRALSRQFESRTIKKQYEALICGQLRPDQGTVNAAIAKFSKQRPLRHLDPDGREAITHWRVIERDAGSTRVALTPKTGRSHQLRLHMQSLGHPILGDVFYGDPNTNARLCLHAKSIEIRHPQTGEVISFSSEVPF
ncbi:MAG: RluA family pseudouridine synthase [Pseudomonadota bacterium]